MDSTQEPLNILSLCTGYGGLELGIERALGKVAKLAHVEIEAFAIANLVNKMETGQMVPAPIWSDLKTFNARVFRGHVDILTGGYPCQPFSAAGKRGGANDPRHLWPYIGGQIEGQQNIIEQCRPRGVFFENVEGHLSLGVCEVLADLERMGYKVAVGIFSAAEVGAPHQRKRVFILAYSEHMLNSKDGRGYAETNSLPRVGRSEVRRGLSGGASRQLWPTRPGEGQNKWEEPRTVADSGNAGLQRYFKHKSNNPAGQPEPLENGFPPPSPANGRMPRGFRVKDKPRLGGTINGPANRVDRLRLLGNGVMPHVAEKAFKTLNRELNQ